MRGVSALAQLTRRVTLTCTPLTPSRESSRPDSQHQRVEPARIQDTNDIDSKESSFGFFVSAQPNASPGDHS